MKCLETKTLLGYAYNLIDESTASEVRLHLAECTRCRQVVAQGGRLDGVLREWKAVEPTPGFDVRVRQTLEAHQAERASWRFWSWQWARGLTLAGVGILIVAGVIGLIHRRRVFSLSSGVVATQPHRVEGTPAPQRTAGPQSPERASHAGVSAIKRDPAPELAGTSSNDDKEAQALEDYDLAANFDVLSELPRGEPQRVAN